ACSIAHKEGGNQTHVHNPIADEAASKEHDATWSDAIRHALDHDGFYLSFQPIVSLHGDTKENYEILIRMRGEDGEEILPEKFISAAHKTDLILQLDRWVIRTALDRLAQEQANGKQLTFFIKLSEKSIADTELQIWISEQLKENRVTGESIVFQLSEPSAMMRLTESKGFIKAMKQLHCMVALEHFGTGVNSLNALKHLDVDYLKIDGALIHDLTDNNESQETVKSIIQTAHSMGKLTIAEYVQDANSLAVLWQFGVNYIEGHFLQEASTELDYDFSSED
ncbi:MAG: EAL domain-containing protein, partial [Granulosicoccaceae bacterium]